MFALFCCAWSRGIRADTQVCPYNGDDAVKMIRHGHEFIQFDMREFIFRFVPPMNNDFPHVIQIHAAFNNFSKQALPVLRANRHEIITRLGIIVML